MSNDTSNDASYERFRFTWSDLPMLTAELPGILGQIRLSPEDFQVTEIPLYLPQGSGSHSYVYVEKVNLTTRDLVVALRDAGVEEKLIGVAGLKDKHARSRQWLSVPRRFEDSLKALETMEGVTVLERSRHKNKLAIGHLQGNHFKIHVRETAADAEAKAKAILEKLNSLGVPNYFGPQRFGRFGGNAIDGFKVSQGENVVGSKQLKRFFLSSLQSMLVNHMLKLRLERNLYDKVIIGDWAKKHDTGGVFEVKDAEVEMPRALRGDISPTFPLYGRKVPISNAQAGSFEREVLEHFGVSWHSFNVRKGARRISRIFLKDTAVESSPEGGLWLSFALPKGAFATSVLREIMKTDVDAPLDSERQDDEE
ncbi:MAG: tRNA pseudouridine(13) synthase TruD [Deinococcales bacterium]